MIAFTPARSCFFFSLLLIGLARASNEPPRRPALRKERALENATKPILGGTNSTWSPTPIDDDDDEDKHYDDDEYDVYGYTNVVNQLLSKPQDFYSQFGNSTEGESNAAAMTDDTSASPSVKPETKSVGISSATSANPSQGSETSSAPSVEGSSYGTNDNSESGTGEASSSTPSKSVSVSSAPSKQKNQTSSPTFAPKSPTTYPTKSPTKRPSPMPTTEAWAGKVKDEENRIKQLADDKTAEVAAALIFFLGIAGMVFTAYQLIEHPDGLCASVCRLSIKFSSFILKVICLPCRLCCSKYSGYATSDPKNRTLFVEEYTNDLELT